MSSGPDSDIDIDAAFTAPTKAMAFVSSSDDSGAPDHLQFEHVTTWRTHPTWATLARWVRQPGGGHLVVSAGGHSSDKELHVHNLDGERVATFTDTQFIYCACASHDGVRLVSAGAESKVSAWCMETNALLQRHNAGPVVRVVEFHPTNASFVAVGTDRAAADGVWDIDSNQYVVAAGSDAWRGRGSCVWSPDGARVVFARATHLTVFSFLVDRGVDSLREPHAEIAMPEGVNLAPRRMHFASDNRQLVVAADSGRSLLLVDTVDGVLLRTLAMKLGVCRRVCFAPSQTHVVTSDEDKEVTVYDLRSDAYFKFRPHGSTIVSGLEFSPCARYLLTSGCNCDVSIWKTPPVLGGSERAIVATLLCASDQESTIAQHFTSQSNYDRNIWGIIASYLTGTSFGDLN